MSAGQVPLPRSRRDGVLRSRSLERVDDDFDVEIADSVEEMPGIGIVILPGGVEVANGREIPLAEEQAELVALAFVVSNPPEIGDQLEFGIHPRAGLKDHLQELVIGRSPNQVLGMRIVTLGSDCFGTKSIDVADRAGIVVVKSTDILVPNTPAEIEKGFVKHGKKRGDVPLLHIGIPGKDSS
jgi:hypothetical protein